MWWMDVKTYQFIWADGQTYTLKVLREIPQYTDYVEIQISGDEKLDEIASRKSVYGDEMEINSYAIFEANVKKLTEANFDISKIGKLKIPVL